jgi:sterol 3beta-glucosyltransferase
MNVSILTYGSRGDLQPYLALAVGLQKAGHTVTLSGPQRFESFVASYNIHYVPLPGDPEELSRAFNDSGDNPFRMVASMRSHVLGIAPQVVSQVLQAAQNADMLVHSFVFTTGAHSLARHLNIPDVSVQTFPMFAPTGDYPNVAFPHLGRLGNILSHRFATQVFWHGGNMGFKQIQRLLPDSFPRTLYWPFANPDERLRTPLLFAISPSVIPASADWPANVSVTGYLFLHDEAYQPPEALSAFLAAGAPPICVSFGSMVNDRAEKTGRILLEAFARRNERAIILTGWGGWHAEPAPENILYLDSAPHSWLLPRCKTFIHHGGAGTTAAGLRAGIPAIVVPHAADQPFWGRRVQALGVGPAPIPVKKLTLARLLTALAGAESPAVIAAAQALGSRIRAEDGVRAAVRLIEQARADFAARNPTSQP